MARCACNLAVVEGCYYVDFFFPSVSNIGLERWNLGATAVAQCSKQFGYVRGCNMVVFLMFTFNLRFRGDN